MWHALGKEKCVPAYGKKTQGKETTWKIKKNIETNVKEIRWCGID
jgi:hypothetical protein